MLRRVQLGEVVDKGRNHWLSGHMQYERGIFEDSCQLQLHSTFDKWERQRTKHEIS